MGGMRQNLARGDTGSSSVSSSSGYSLGATDASSESSSSQGVWTGQEDVLGQLYRLAGNVLGGGGAGGVSADAAGAGIDAWKEMLKPGQNPYFDSAVQASIDRATDTFKRQVMPDLEARGV